MTTLAITTPSQRVRVARIVTAMSEEGLPEEFLAAVHDLALRDQGAFELMALWEEFRGADREATLADLEELIRDNIDAPHNGPLQKPRFSGADTERVLNEVAAHKAHLRELVDRHGGVSCVARLMGTPQPSLSRMLSSASMPRRATLFKLAKALGEPESAVISDWVR
jgi:hypothetical protein